MRVRLDEGAKSPTKNYSSDAGFDLYSRRDSIVHPHSSRMFNTGVHIELPKNTCGLLVSKSGLNVKNGITSTGLIDEGYTGSIIVKLYNNSDEAYWVHKGDKISQLLLLPVIKEDIEIVQSLKQTDRGDKGFGSSGK